MIKRLSTMEETWVQSLGWEDPLEKGMATHSSILAWRITMAVEPGRLQTMESQRVRHDWVTKHTLWGCTTQREAKSGRKRATTGDRTPSLVCMVMWSENESLNIMIKKQNGMRKRNRSGLFTPLSPERELRSVFIWCQFMVHWSRWLQGWEGENLLLKSKLFSQICVWERRPFSHSRSNEDQFPTLPTFLAAQHLHVFAQPSPVSLCSCCDTTFHTMANFTCLHFYTLGSWSLSFTTVILISANCQGNKLNATFACSVCFRWGILAFSTPWPRHRSKHEATCHMGHMCCPWLPSLCLYF